MIKKIICSILSVSLVFPLGGCWNYRGINEETLISGIAIDKDKLTGGYRLTYEIVDLTKDIREHGVQSKIVEAEGKTLLDVARNAKKRLMNKLFFGNTQVIVVSREIAEDGLFPIVDWFLRDGECRETVKVVVSQEATAKEILLSKGIDNMLVAYEINAIIDKDQSMTGSTRKIEMYTIFNTLEGEGASFVLPAVRNVINDGQPTVEANGIALFKQDKLLGFLPPSEAKCYLFATGDIHGGVLTLPSKSAGPAGTSFEIFSSRTKRSYSYEGGRVSIDIKTETQVYLDELHTRADLLDEQEIKGMEAAVEENLANEIKALIEKVQTGYDSDIFGFGNMIYKKDPKLWKELSPDWDGLFRTADVSVLCEVAIANSAYTMKT